MDWSGCDLVEVVPGRVGGVPILKGSRVLADSIMQNNEGGSLRRSARISPFPSKRFLDC
jgi:uncharacterized protein (DUF433 family)